MVGTCPLGQQVVASFILVIFLCQNTICPHLHHRSLKKVGSLFSAEETVPDRFGCLLSVMQWPRAEPDQKGNSPGSVQQALPHPERRRALEAGQTLDLLQSNWDGPLLVPYLMLPTSLA